MIAVKQRVNNASVSIDGQVHASIQKGLLVLLGITHTDTNADADWLCRKICDLRIFSDENGKMNLSLRSIPNGNVLLVSQFTLHASTVKGNRPSFIEAARPEYAIPLYEYMIEKMTAELEKPVMTGVFGADMQVALLNDGPVTIIIDSKDRK
jgi:D-tyrosyl-tRNA(Tyr) deacylase